MLQAPLPNIDQQPLGWLRQTIYVLAIGFILFFFSERLFWTVFGSDAQLSDLILTWLAYSAVAYLFLAICRRFQVCDFASLYLSSAIFGWLLEGGIAPTLYGTEPSSPFPLSIIWTTVAWHATLSVWLGWHRLGTALREGRLKEVAVLSLCFGVFWGMWAMFPWQETPPVKTGPDEFLFHAFLMSALLTGSYWVENRLQHQRHFQPGPLGLLIALAAWGIFWIQHVAAIGWPAPLILGSLLLLTMVPLWRSREARREPNILSAHHCGAQRLSYLMLIVLLPTTSTATYLLAVDLGLAEQSIAPVILVLSSVAGVALLLLAYFKVSKAAYKRATLNRSW